jgi:hypothetical protein
MFVSGNPSEKDLKDNDDVLFLCTRYAYIDILNNAVADNIFNLYFDVSNDIRFASSTAPMQLAQLAVACYCVAR